MDESNRRRFPRFEVQGLQCSLDGHPCDLLRLSQGGLLAASMLRPSLDMVFNLELPLDGSVFRSTARVAFVGPDTHEPELRRNRIGVEFLAVPRRSADTLERYLKEHNSGSKQPL